MTERELSKYYYLKKEVQDLEDRIKEFGSGIKSNQFKEISVTSSHSNKSVEEKKLELISLLTEKRISALEQYLEIERYIEDIEDVEIRNLMRYRFLDLMTWEQIAEKVFQERTTISKKIKKFIKSNEKKE